MNEFSGILPSEFSLKSQSRPMAARSAASHTPNFDLPSRAPNSSSWSSTPIGGSIDQSSLFSSNPKSQDPGNAFDDILGGGGSAPARRKSKSGDDAFDFDWSGGGNKSAAANAAAPVYDKPLYDDDVFDGVPGLKSSSSVKYEDVFSSISSPTNKSDAFDDLLGNLGRAGPEMKNSGNQGSQKGEKGVLDFDDLIPGFGSGPKDRFAEDVQHPKITAHAAKSTSNVMEDPFVVLESSSQLDDSSSGKFTDPLDQVNDLSSSDNIKVDTSSRNSGVFDDLDPLDGLGNYMPSNSSEINTQGKTRPVPSTSSQQNYFVKEPWQRPSAGVPDSQPQRAMPIDKHMESRQAFFDMPTVSSDPHKFVGRTSPPPYVNSNLSGTKVQGDMSPQSEENLEPSDDVWLTVSEIPLFTQPTSAPPPLRPPPPRPVHVSKGETFSLNSRNARRNINEFPNSPHFQSSKSASTTVRVSGVSQIDELENFATGRSQNNVDEDRDTVSVEEVEADLAAAAMKEAMDRAEAKFRHAKEVRERENAKAGRSKEAGYFDRDEKLVQDAQEKAFHEKQERLERERRQKEREEEIEQKRIEKEKERAREIERERERERARQAVERATREARERAAAEARLKAERAAVDKANAEARLRAERTAVQRAQAEARGRAAAEAKLRAEKAAAESRERANAEARDKEAQERAVAAAKAAVARERAASARANQQKNENDVESFFSMGARPSSAPRPRSNSSESPFDSQFQNKQGSEPSNRTSSVSSSIKKASSTTNIVDDLSSIFGATPSSGNFQEVEGETEERRQARMERHHRTQERAAKALAEKNERDLQAQRDQAERHRIAETLDAEIKRWAAGKEGNLRALLSTMQYVLWPECGWQPVSLTDLITGASVKKVYRKATLCIHPDKVQQKGANLQQKYIAEKVFDLLKEAWNKFNSEELF